MVVFSIFLSMLVSPDGMGGGGVSVEMSLVRSAMAGVLVAWVSWSSWVVGDLAAPGGGRRGLLWLCFRLTGVIR